MDLCCGHPAGRTDAVIWDWNGTLLDDVHAGLTTMNAVLDEAGLPALADVDAYRRAFGFPVREFYRGVGFDADDAFLAASTSYLARFPEQVATARLNDGAAEAVAALARRGIRQVLISATLTPVLHAQLAPHELPGLEEVLGIDSGAENPSKLGVVERWLRTSGLVAGRVVMVGDTNHDEQVADALGARFIRFAGGHQHVDDAGHWPVVHRLVEVPTLV